MIQVVDTSGSESDNGSSFADVEPAEAHDWLASSHSFLGAATIVGSDDSDNDDDDEGINDWLQSGPRPDLPIQDKQHASIQETPDIPVQSKARTESVEMKAGGPNEPLPLVAGAGIRDTTVVKKKKAQLPTHNLPHPTPISGDWLNSRTMINNYIILESLGVGSYAEVKLCKEKASGQLFAMKFIDRDIMHKHGKLNRQPDALNDIKREIAIMKKLNHPNVLRLFEVMDDPHVNKLFLVLEFMQLGDLLSFTKKTKPASTSDTICAPMLDPELHGVALQVLHGLAYLHDQNIVHGDLKPQNLLIGEQGIVKIADFGISQNLYGSKQQLLESKGTPAFMSPEMCSGVQYSGQLADVWAVGATLYMLKFGNPPFVAKTTLQVFEKIQNDPVVLPGAVDPALADFLHKIMTKDPSRRLALADALSHPWITKDRSLRRRPLLNVRITVSADEIDSAIHATSSLLPATTPSAGLPTAQSMGTAISAPPTTPPTSALEAKANARSHQLQALHRNTGSSKRRLLLQNRNQHLSSEEMHYRSEMFAQKKSHPRLIARNESSFDDLLLHPSDDAANSSDGDDDDDEHAIAPSMHHLDELLLTTLAPTAQAVLPPMLDNMDALTASSANLMLREPCNAQLHIRLALASVQGRRTTQEDRCMVIPNLASYDCGRDTMAFVGIYDGHSGVTAASYLQEHLHRRLLRTLTRLSRDATSHAIVDTVQDACIALDSDLCDHLYASDCPSGSTATFVFLECAPPSRRRLVLGHVGDCRAVVCRDGAACVLTKDHRCTTKDEVDLVVGIIGAHAIINNRINGVLAITRTFGDLEFKGRTRKASERAARVYSQEAVNTVLSATPDVLVLDIEASDAFLLLACDGLWEAMNCEAAVAFVASRLALHGQLQVAAEELTQEAVRCLSSDNVSVVLYL
ncbi:CAMKK/META protein kinase [Saprolegnia parasitica CBS 223.65]|uniref:CAMKK/META protein kinase n=1 Tax=Saprolegnia parasitica (strain CBS 223.65) TaxID=695850 RepID=A0A067CLC8_SAPPC|nr:CAMKK/META protein kinase [Saprolegnia parasitica CBS 223.65]KDO27346.1 CAMKK/META protein kinase [Saprolegnia parasitica CBS 223.65]|eukprot:XP_012201790.1 CAMKK/META protein kinase [Saprolegnia parasitica CBS 223.65]